MVYTIGILRSVRTPSISCRPMDERLRFIARLLEGEEAALLCREFGISSRIAG
jgi:hypothetical protein